MMEEAATWINSSQDYDQGITILEEIKPNHPLLPILKAAENSWATEKLQEILLTLSGSPQEKKVSLAKTATRPKPIKEQKQRIQSSELPDEFKDEYENRIRRMYALIGSVRSEFNRDLLLDHHRKVSNKIQEILDHINGFYSRVRRFQESGELVIHRSGLFHQYKEMEVKIKSAKQYISRNRKDPKMGKAINQREIEVDAMEKELQELEGFLLEYA